jgi:hypothetical protein
MRPGGVQLAAGAPVSTKLVSVLTTRTSEADAVRWLSLFIAVAGLSAACGGRERINVGCQWTHDTAFEIDVTNRTHQTHLRYDADLMEDLAIRYADAHAGRAGRPQWPEARDACMTKLFAVIGNDHGVGRTNPTVDRPSQSDV